LLFDSIGHTIAFTLATSRKIKWAQRVGLFKYFKNIATFESIGTIAMHKKDTDVCVCRGLEEWDMQFLVTVVVDGKYLMVEINIIEEIICMMCVLPRWKSE